MSTNVVLLENPMQCPDVHDFCYDSGSPPLTGVEKVSPPMNRLMEVSVWMRKMFLLVCVLVHPHFEVSCFSLVDDVLAATNGLGCLPVSILLHQVSL